MLETETRRPLNGRPGWKSVLRKCEVAHCTRCVLDSGQLRWIYTVRPSSFHLLRGINNEADSRSAFYRASKFANLHIGLVESVSSWPVRCSDCDIALSECGFRH